MITAIVILVVKLAKTKKALKEAWKAIGELQASEAELNNHWQKTVDMWIEKGQGHFIEVCKLQKERIFWIRQIKAVVSEDKMSELYEERDNILEEYCKANGYEW